MKKREFKISFFLHVWEKKAEEISLEEFHNDLRGARWKVLAESYRRWMRTGMTEEGKRLKGALNAVVVAGKCRGGHAANQVTELNGLALFDFDHCLEMLAGMKEKAGALPYVVGAFVSISGEGLKLIVRIDAENAGQYAVAYPVVARELERVLGHPCDMSCRDLGRACYASYDPEAYYNPGAGVFPWREQVDGLLQAEGECSEQSVGKACPAGVASEAGDGFMQVFLNDFDARNPFVAGGRHAFVLKLGRVARYKGFSPEEMRLLQKAVVEKYAQADFGSGEIEKTLSSGYQYVSARRADAMTTDLGPKVQGPFYGYPILWEKIVFVVKKYFLKIFCSLAHSGDNVKYIILYMCVIYVCFRVVYYLFLCPLVFKVFIYNYLIFNVLYRSLFLSFNCGIP